MKIGYFDRDGGASMYYRVHLPIQTLTTKTRHESVCYKRGDPTDILEEFFNADLLVFPRVSEAQFLKVMPKLRDDGKKVIIDHDDNSFCISPMNNAYQFWGDKEVLADINGEKFVMWADVNRMDELKDQHPIPNWINLKMNHERIENYRKALEAADLVTVTQPILADAYSKYSKNIMSLPNCVDLSMWNRLPLLPHDEIRLYWSGGSSHYEDLCILTEVVPRIMEKYKNTKMIIMGQRFEGINKRFPQDRFEFYPWVANPAYHFQTQIINPDIALIPLHDNDFNRCKSPIKWVEMAAFRCPSVTSNVDPYKELATEENGIFVENDPESWFEGISMMIEDEKLRRSITEAAYQTVRDKYNIDKSWTLWLDAYEELAA
jgi:glycosyltransferase involved in cell wall biosynthesis